MNGIYIAGTGTDVGKTSLALAGCLWVLEQGRKAAYYKPVQCGAFDFPPGKLGGDMEWVSHFSGGRVPVHCSYFLKTAVSPHLAAENEGLELEPAKISDDCAILLEENDAVFIEGVGGLAVPLNREGLTLTDILGDLDLNYSLVCSPFLGTLNHSLLSLRYMEANGVLPGVFFMCQMKPSLPEIFEDNIRVIESRGSVAYGGCVPYLQNFATGDELGAVSLARFIASVEKGMGRLLS